MPTSPQLVTMSVAQVFSKATAVGVGGAQQHLTLMLMPQTTGVIHTSLSHLAAIYNNYSKPNSHHHHNNEQQQYPHHHHQQQHPHLHSNKNQHHHYHVALFTTARHNTISSPHPAAATTNTLEMAPVSPPPAVITDNTAVGIFLSYTYVYSSITNFPVISILPLGGLKIISVVQTGWLTVDDCNSHPYIVHMTMPAHILRRSRSERHMKLIVQ